MMRALMTKTLFVLSILLSAQALAFDVGGFSYTVINATDVEVTGRASGNTDTDIVFLPLFRIADTPTALRPLGMMLSRQRPHQRDYSRQRYDHWGLCFRQQRPHQRDYRKQRYDHWGCAFAATPSPA